MYKPIYFGATDCILLPALQLCFDASELLSGLEAQESSSFSAQSDRYDTLRMCVGNELCNKLANINLFMVSLNFVNTVMP